MLKKLCVWFSLWILFFSGCQSSPEEKVTEAQPGSVQLHWFFVSGTSTHALAAEIAKAYNASQDQVELILEAVHPSQSSARYQAMIESGNLPDILGPLDASEYPALLQAGLLLDDLEPMLVDQLTDIAPPMLDLWRVEGKLAGVPVGIRDSVLYYNRKLFDAAGLAYPPHKYGETYADGSEWNTQKLEELAMLLTLDSSNNDSFNPSFDAQHIAQYGFTWHWMNGRGLVNIFGADPLVDKDGNVSIPEGWREGYRWYSSGIWEKHFIPSGNYDTRTGLISGNMGMLINNMWYLKNLKDAPFQWDLAVIPSYQGEATVDWLGGAMFISRSTAQPDLAVKAAYDLANNVELLKVGGYIPAFQSQQTAVLRAL